MQTHPGIAVLVLTMAGTDDSLVAALRAGARGYLLKEAGRQEISHALRSVAAGQAVFGTRVADRILSRLTEPPAGRTGTSSAFPPCQPAGLAYIRPARGPRARCRGLTGG
jgi:DNA-binding NarL/FixJ family response regulator